MKLRVAILVLLVPLVAGCGGDWMTEKGEAAYQRKEYSEAETWFMRAADFGNPQAQYRLGEMYLNGLVTGGADHKMAAEWFEKAATKGNADAQESLGNLFYYGDGVPKDTEKAAEFYRKAAEMGKVNSQVRYGRMCLNGEGVGYDPAEAARWIRKAAQHSVSEALLKNDSSEARLAASPEVISAKYYMGVMYAEGKGLPKDAGQAAKWYEDAASSGHAGAQNNLGAMYGLGEGVPQDEEKAMYWYRKAAAQGDPTAQQNLKSREERNALLRQVQGFGGQN